MQHTLFEEFNQELPLLELQQDFSDKYPPRTAVNAKNSDITLAIAVDFLSAGEILTKKLAYPRYLAVPFGIEDFSTVTSFLKLKSRNQSDPLVINIAGNGQYTFGARGISQQQVNKFVFKLLKEVLNSNISVKRIRSGGQTGADLAGLVAGVACGVPVLGYFPKGFKQKNQQGVTLIDQNPLDIQVTIEKMAQELVDEHKN